MTDVTAPTTTVSTLPCAFLEPTPAGRDDEDVVNLGQQLAGARLRGDVPWSPTMALKGQHRASGDGTWSGLPVPGRRGTLTGAGWPGPVLRGASFALVAAGPRSRTRVFR